MEKIKKNVKCILVHAFVIVKIYRKCPFYLPKYCFTETSTLRPTQSSHLLVSSFATPTCSPLKFATTESNLLWR